MGMYTHLVLNVTFQKDTPKEMIDTIRYMIGDTEDKPPEQDHELFATNRWPICLHCDSAYFMGTTCSTFEKSIINEWELTVNSNCKNYNQEYQKFLDYIQPYIENFEFLGFMRYEEYDHPTLIYNTYRGIEYYTPEVKLKGDLW